MTIQHAPKNTFTLTLGYQVEHPRHGTAEVGNFMLFDNERKPVVGDLVYAITRGNDDRAIRPFNTGDDPADVLAVATGRQCRY